MDKGFKGTINLNGRPKGSLNKTTTETKELIKNIVGDQMGSVEVLLNKLEPKERLDFIIRLLPFVIPKQQSIEVDTTDDNAYFRPLVIHLVKPNSDGSND